MTFKDWWNSAANPARNMPETTREQMRWHMAQAYAAGRKEALKQAAVAYKEEIFE